MAPNDGFILTRSREIGAIVQAGETVLTLTLTSPVWVRTYVNERDLGLVHPGMPASVTNDTAPDRPYSAQCRLHLPNRRIHPQDGRDARDQDEPRLPAARGRGQPRRRPAAGDAGHGEDASAPAAALDALAAPAAAGAKAMSEETLILAENLTKWFRAADAASHRSSLCAHRPGRSHRRCRP